MTTSVTVTGVNNTQSDPYIHTIICIMHHFYGDIGPLHMREIFLSNYFWI